MRTTARRSRRGARRRARRRPVEGADHDAVRLHEVAHADPSAVNSGIRDVADVLEAARVEPREHLLAGPDRDGALHHEERAARDVLGKLVDDRPDGERSASPEYVGGVPTAT